MADDITAEADSGGHTDGRSLVSMLSALIALANRKQVEFGPFPERLMNLCAQREVDFWGLEWLDEHTLRLTTRRRTLGRMRGTVSEPCAFS